MSAGGTSSSSYSIILLSLSGWPHALTHKPLSHTRTHAHRGALLRHVNRGFFFFILRRHPKLRSRAYLLGPLAPGPAEALEGMHCHLTSVLSSQRVQKLGHLRAPPASPAPGSTAHLLFCGCFETGEFPLRKHAADRRECSCNGRKPCARDLQPAPPPPLSVRPDRLGYVTDCCVIAADLGFCRAVLGWEM